MRGLLERIQRARRQPFHAMTAQEARAAYELAAEVLEPPRTPLERVENFAMPLEVPECSGLLRPARLYAPSRERLPLLLFLHGGKNSMLRGKRGDSVMTSFLKN